MTMWSRRKWSNLVLLKLKGLELTSAGNGESCGKMRDDSDEGKVTKYEKIPFSLMRVYLGRRLFSKG